MKYENQQVTTLFRAKIYAEQANATCFLRSVILKKISLKNRFFALADCETET